MTEKFDVIIIGSGIGGLISGCYLAKSGNRVLLVEKNSNLGGYCASFQRGEYHFDVGVHYLGGVKDGIMGTIFDELGLRDRIKIIRIDPVDRILIPPKNIFIRADWKNTVEELQKQFPKEKENVYKFISFIKNNDLPRIYRKTLGLSFKKLLDDCFKSYEIKACFNVLLKNWGVCAQDISAFSSSILFKEYILDPGYYPLGGMQQLPNELGKIIIENNGKILFNKKVKQILIRNNNVTGVMLKSGERFQSNAVVSNADLRETFTNLLDAKVEESSLLNLCKPSATLFTVYLGVRNIMSLIKQYTIWPVFTLDLCQSPVRDVKDVNSKYPFLSSINLSFNNLFELSKKNNNLSIRICSLVGFEGKKIWDKLKNRFSNKLIIEAERLIPFLKNNIDVKVISTPWTLYRFTLNHKGASFGFIPAVKHKNLKFFSCLTSVKGLFLSGHWTRNGLGGGGVAKAAFSGRNTAFVISKLKMNK